ncbi:MAG: hypothetical protein OES09_00450, partial [Gammaproteobacteria bacterium]|nr:hypothetical protein [Gammaproteobacteria bacterium]
DTIAGADVDPHLPFGPDAKEWHRFMNECQMRLHGCAINDARERSGTPTANSVWFWGGGRLPTAPQSRPWELVFTEDSLFQGLAAVAGTPSAPLPGNMDALLERVSAGQRALLVCCSLRSLLWMPDTEQGGRALERLDETWVAPAIRALREGRLRVLTVSDPEYGDIVLTARGVRRWWRAWGWKPSRRIKTTKA